ncbi:MAG: hemolysin family protein [Acidobacteriota bacterium]
MDLSTWIVIFILIAVNALYVAAEFAAVSVRQSRVRQAAEEGDRIAGRLLPWLEDPRKLDEYIAASQIGITLSSLILGAFGQANLSIYLVPFFERFGNLQNPTAQTTSAAIVLIGLTTLQVILGELVPKSIALQYSTQTALLTFIPMRWSLSVFSWFITVLNGSGVAILKAFRIPYSGHRHIHSPEEIEMLITESRDGGVLEPDEHHRLHRALQLGMRPTHQLMVPRRYVAGIDASTPPERILSEIADSPFSHLPVYSGSIDNVIGMLHTKDVVLHFIEKGCITSIEEVMRPAMHVPETVTADGLLTLMRQQRKHQAVVLDEFGGTEGLVTLEDVLKDLLGEIADEFKTEESQPTRLRDGRVRLPGHLRLDEAEPWTGILWMGEADTVSGLITETLGHMPDPGERLTLDGVDIVIERVEHHAIVSVIATPVVKENANG